MKVLIVDDEKNIRESIAKYLELEGVPANEAGNGVSAQRLLQEEVFSAAVIDLKMPGMDGLELLAWIRDESLQLPVIMISAHGEITDAVKAMKLGAADYLVKPFDPDELVMRVKRVIQEGRLRMQVESGRLLGHEHSELIGKSKVMAEIKKIVSKVARVSSTVLITGESGVGKEVVARSIHTDSAVADGPFIAVNIGGIPEALLESELFGHEKGAFTGAVSQKIGMFELASNGTIFLDEIGDMPLHLQVKLLRVLQERKVRRLGGTRQIPIDARFVTATNKDLEARAKRNEFREDLFYRLNVVHIQVPPLRERLDDIAELAGFFLAKHNSGMGRHLNGFAPEALEMLRSYSWPGNIRELENMIERAVIFAEGEKLLADDLALPDNPDVIRSGPLKDLRQAERDLIAEALLRWEGNRTKTAESLGINRRTLFNKIREYGIVIEDLK
jgi:two-component system, NtrC family, response regulator AtoC